MDVHHLEVLRMEQHIIRRGQSMDSDTISHASSMFQTVEIKDLLNSAGSGAVLVNGCIDRTQNTKITPLTYVCATLTYALRRSPGQNVVLSFFCGQHSISADNLVGPQGLMRSLVTFLVLDLVQKGHISDSVPIPFQTLERDFEAISFKDICHLFYHLIERIPHGITIYCVVDGISQYERLDWKEDYHMMMDCFGSIISNETIGATFKLLLTSPTNSRWIPNFLPHQRVSLRNTRRRGVADPEVYLQATLQGLAAVQQ
jgi:hypothetical protein